LCWTLCSVPCGVLGLNASQHGPPAGRVYLFYFPLTKMNQPKHMTRGWGPGVRGESAGGVARELGPESWDQRVGRVGTRSCDRRVRTRSWDRGCDGSPPKMRRESWDRRVGTRSWDQRVGTGGCVASLLEVGPESSDRRVGTKELGPGVGTRGLGPESWDQRVQSREL
jgi:hypothetical protein